MNKFLILLSFLSGVSIQRVLGQRQFLTKEYNHENINVRTDLAFALAKIELEVKQKGKVIVSMEGTCKSTFGDVITFGVSNSIYWTPDFGNVSVAVFDTLQNTNRYFHTLTFDVDPGQHIFSALAQNWTGRSGTGYINVSGNLILEYIPEENQEIHIYKNISKYPFVIKKDKSVVDSVSILTNKQANILISFNGRFYSKPENEVLVVLNDKPSMDNALDSFNLSTPDLNRYPEFSFKILKEVPAGKHQFYVMVRKLKGDLESSENAFYSTLTATIYYKEIESSQALLQKKKATTLADKNLNSLGNIIMNIPKKGKIQVTASGFIDLKKAQQLSLLLELKSQKLNQKDSILLLINHPQDQKTFYSMNKIYEVEMGPVQIDLKSMLKTGFTQNIVQNDLLIKYISNDLISSRTATEAFSDDLYIYPNPSNNVISLAGATNWVNGSSRINIFDENGRQLNMNGINQDQKEFNISELENGKYFLNVQNGNISKIIRFIKVD